MDTTVWLADPELARLFGTLHELGEARFIGGCVRDSLLGAAHSDIDLATPTLPEAAMRRAEKAGFRVVGTGLAHGTFTAVLPGGPVEVTTLRRDIETDGRHAVVSFTGDWQADAARRDFTINALSCGADGAVFDYFAGMDDLEAGRVRFIGQPTERLAEDYLRALRFFRFTARFAVDPDEAALQAIAKAAPQMVRLSGERVRSELWKLLAGPRAAEMWQAMTGAGVIAAILPGATDAARLGRTIAVETRHELNDPLRRLMGSLSPIVIPEPSSGVHADGVVSERPPGTTLFEISERLKLSGSQRQRLSNVANASTLAALRVRDYGRALYKADLVSVLDNAVLHAAVTSDETTLSELLAFLENWREPRFPLGGESLKKLGVEPGPLYGELLRAAEAWWIENGFRPDRDACLEQLRQIITGKS